MKLSPKLTHDGSITLFDDARCEHYHSIHGAIQESMFVFVEAGLKKTTENHLNILEVGFGTGLNALLSLIEAGKKEVRINYIAIEPNPIPHEVYTCLNYPAQLKNNRAAEFFEILHTSPFGVTVEVRDGFSITKIFATLEATTLPDSYFDLIYFDAFSPEIQPELWTIEIFKKLYNASAPGAVMVTYSAKGMVRRNMISAGFQVERLPGPVGKREMLRAKKLGF